MMNPYAFPPLLAALLNSILIVWVFTQAREGLVRYSFLLWNICLAAWNLGVAVGLVLPTAAQASAWYILVGSFAVRFIAPTFLHFVATFTGTDTVPRVRFAVILAYISGGVFTGLGLTSNLLMKEVVHYYWGYYPLAGRYEWTFGLSLYLICGYAFWLLVKTRNTSTGYRRNQVEYILTGAAIVFGAGFTNFLPLYGISVYPIGNLMNSLYSLLVAYAIIEYGLMDISVILRRGTVYAMLSGGLTVVYLSIVAVMQRLFGHYGVQENYVFYTAAFPITVILAPAMKTRIEPWVDHTLFGKTAMDRGASSKAQEIAFMGILATEMAHELAKPLTHIMNEGSRLEHSVKGPARESVMKIGKEVQRATEILDGFVLLSPGRPLHRMAVSLVDLLEEALTTLNLEHDHSLKVVRQLNEIPPTLVNPGQMVQVFTNLIQNAWQAMPNGGRLTLALREVKRPSHPPSVEIAITDSGSGIPPALQSKIFEPFFTTKEAQGGRGVGLTLSRAILERHGGHICIESPLTPAGGTRILIRLPIHPKEDSHAT